MKRLIRKAYEWEASETKRKEVENWLRENSDWYQVESQQTQWKNSKYPNINYIDIGDQFIDIYFNVDPEITQNPVQDFFRKEPLHYVVDTLSGLQTLLSLIK
jgi:hypothetical protein